MDLLFPPLKSHGLRFKNWMFGTPPTMNMFDGDARHVRSHGNAIREAATLVRQR